MINLKFDPFPILETERLVLREITKDDTNEIFKMRSDPVTMKYIPRPLVNSIEEVHDLIQKMNDGEFNMNFAISIKPNPSLIGIIGFFRTQHEHFRSEFGYNLSPDHWNKGIITEAIPPMLKFGFEDLNLHSMEARIHPDNAASRKVLLKNDFVKEGYFKHDHFFNEKFQDTEVYSLLKADWRRAIQSKNSK
jgi:ribosomal-protein-alanine N-acetyltransferase